jgi:hypothetical protein
VWWRQSSAIWDVQYRGAQFQVARRASGRFFPVVTGGDQLAFETFMPAVGAGWAMRSTPAGTPPASPAQPSARDALQQALRVFRNTEWGSANRVPVTEIPVPGDPWDAVLAVIRHIWPQVLDSAKRRSRPLYAFLLETAPLKVDGCDLLVVVRYQFHLNALNEKRYRDRVTEILSEVTGTTWRVCFELG